MKTKHEQNYEDKIFIYDRNVPCLLRKCITFCMPFLSVWFGIIRRIYNLFYRKRIDKKYTFSICAIFKDESLILKEWIEYHFMMGVEHFYLYNNNSTDNYKEILEPYITGGGITLIDWNFPPPQQFPAYKHFYDNFRTETQWVAFIDLDEFIVPYRDIDIKTWIARYKNYPAVVAYWKQFGTNGKLGHDHSKLIMEQYINCWDKFFSIGKTFFNTDYEVYEFSARNLHAMSAGVKIFGHKFILPPINEFFKYILFKNNRIGFINNQSSFSLQINHYGTKAFDCYMHNKMVRGDVNNHVRDLSTFYWSEQYCTDSDYKIYRFICKLKNRL